MEDARKRGASAAYWLVGLALMLLMMGTNVPTPLYAVYRGEWGFSAGVLALIFSSYTLTLIPSLLLFGRLSDAFGRRGVFLTGLTVAALGGALFALAQGAAWLFAARMTQGIAVGIASGAATAALAELNPRGDRQAGALVATVAVVGGGAVGPLFGGLLAQYGPPRELVFPYVAYLVLFVPAVLVLWAKMPETVSVETGARPSWRPGRPRVPADVRGPFVLGASACFAGWAAGGLFAALVPSYASDLLNVRNLALGGGMTFAMLGCATVVQVLLGGTEPLRAIALGAASLVVGLAAIVAAVPAQSVWLLLAGALFDGAGLGLSFMGGVGLVGKVAPPENRAEILSACYVFVYLGVGLPVVGVGLAAGRVGLFAAVAGFAAVVGGVCLIVALFAAFGSRTAQ